MALLYIFFTLYIIWGFPVLMTLTYFAAKSFLVFGMKEAIILFCIQLLLFTPMKAGSQTFFSETYMPWSIAYLLAPPAPIFSFLGLAVGFVLSALSLFLVYWFAIR